MESETGGKLAVSKLVLALLSNILLNLIPPTKFYMFVKVIYCIKHGIRHKVLCSYRKIIKKPV